MYVPKLYKVSFKSGSDSWLTTNYPSSPKEYNIVELTNPWEVLLNLNGSIVNQTFSCGGFLWLVTRERIANNEPDAIFPWQTRLSMTCEEIGYTLSKIVD